MSERERRHVWALYTYMINFMIPIINISPCLLQHHIISLIHVSLYGIGTIKDINGLNNCVRKIFVTTGNDRV
jgi:hypothetical protein